MFIWERSGTESPGTITGRTLPFTSPSRLVNLFLSAFLGMPVIHQPLVLLTCSFPVCLSFTGLSGTFCSLILPCLLFNGLPFIPGKLQFSQIRVPRWHAGYNRAGYKYGFGMLVWRGMLEPRIASSLHSHSRFQRLWFCLLELQVTVKNKWLSCLGPFDIEINEV